MAKAAGILNPAWDIWCRVYGPEIKDFSQYSRMNFDLASLRNDVDDFTNGFHLRTVVIHHMTFAIPSPNALDTITKYGPIVEMGAGTGYWAWCLEQLGVDIIAYDHLPPDKYPHIPDQANRYSHANGWFDSWWTRVRLGTPGSVRKHGDRALLMVWPFMDDMAIDTLRAYPGDTLIYVGEERAACANEAFFDELDASWNRIEDIPIPQWPGLHDEMWVMKRK